MKNIRGFNDYIYTPLLKKLDENFLLENFNIGKYQKSITNFYKIVGVELYYALTYQTAIAALIPVVSKLIENGTFEMEATLKNSVMITIFSVSILTNETKDKVEKIYSHIIESGLIDNDINKVIEQLKNIKSIFTIIVKLNNKKIDTFIDMLSYTSLLIPFLNVFNNMVSSGFINSDQLGLPFKEFNESLGETKMKMLINRILHKLNIMTSSTDKFQNKDNNKPLKVNDEFKSPQYKTEDTILSENKQNSISDIVRELTREFVEEYNVPADIICHGHCVDFADNLYKILKNMGYDADIISDTMFYDEFGDEEPEMMWDANEYGNKPDNFDDIGLPGHNWVYVNGKHYDAEAPDGVTDMFELPIIKDFYSNGTIIEEATG